MFHRLNPIRTHTLSLLAALIFLACSCPRSYWRPPRRNVEIYDPTVDKWRRGKKLPVPLAGARCATIGGLIYVVGGSDREREATAHLLRFDPVAKTWEELADIPTSRVGHEVVPDGTDLYVFGGGRFPGRDDVEIFDTVSETWSVALAMPTPRTSFGAVEQGGLIYVMGGGTVVVESLDPVTGLWQTLSPMPQPVFDFATESNGVSIYVIGGALAPSPPLQDVHIYDPMTDTWNSGPPLPQAATHLDSAIIGQEILVVGAFGPQFRGRYYFFGDDRKRLLSLDTRTGAWTDLSPKNRKLFDVGVASAGGLVYSFGGRGRREEQ